MNKQEITNLINTIYDAVNESKVAPIAGKDSKGDDVIKNLGYGTFTTILSSLTPKNISGDMDMKVSEPKEPWKG